MSSLGNGQSLPFQEAKDMERLLLEETSKKPVKSGILSSLFKSVRLSGDILNPLIRTAYDSISDPVLVLLIASRTLVYANKSAHVAFSHPSKSNDDTLHGVQVTTILPDLTRDKLNEFANDESPSDVVMSARFTDGKVPVSVSFGRLAQEGLNSSQIGPTDILVLTLKKIMVKTASGNILSRYRSEFEEIKTVGKGGFGIVVQAKNRLDGQEYAIKKVRLSCSPENANIFTSSTTPTKESKWFKGHSRHLSESDHRLINEVKTFALLSNHPNVIRYYNAWIEPVIENDDPMPGDEDDSDSDESLFEGATQKHHSTLFIQMQLCPYQDLRRWISSSESIRLDSSLNIFWQIVSGLVHIHSQGVIHRDVKPENIFVHQDHVFLGDFGLAKNIQDHALSPSPDQTLMNESFVTRTFLYMAPEILSSQTCTTKSDIYSLGIILFELLTHFDTAMERVVTLNQLKSTGIIPPFFRDQFPSQSLLLEELLAVDPQARPTAQEVLASEVFYDVVTRRNTLSSFGGTDSPDSIPGEFDPFLFTVNPNFRRRSGESYKEGCIRTPLRGTKSVVSLDDKHKPQTRERRATEDLGWMPWGPSCVHEDPVDVREPPSLVSSHPWEHSRVPTVGDARVDETMGISLPFTANAGYLHPNRCTSSASFVESSRLAVQVQGEDFAKSRIKSLERDVALLEAKLKAMTAHSIYLESELGARVVTPPCESPMMEREGSGESAPVPIPIPFYRMA